MELLFHDSTAPCTELNYDKFQIFSLGGCFSHESTGLVNYILVSPYNVVLCVFVVPQSL